MIGRLVKTTQGGAVGGVPLLKGQERENVPGISLFSKLAEPDFQLRSFSSRDSHSFITMLRLNMLRASKSLLSFLLILLAHVATVERWVH